MQRTLCFKAIRTRLVSLAAKCQRREQWCRGGEREVSPSQRQQWGPDTGGACGPCEKVGPLMADDGNCQRASNRALVRSPCRFRHGEGVSEGSTAGQRGRLEFLVVADKSQQSLLNKQGRKSRVWDDTRARTLTEVQGGQGAVRAEPGSPGRFSSALLPPLLPSSVP